LLFKGDEAIMSFLFFVAAHDGSQIIGYDGILCRSLVQYGILGGDDLGGMHAVLTSRSFPLASGSTTLSAGRKEGLEKVLTNLRKGF
jgi:hypothetical protein